MASRESGSSADSHEEWKAPGKENVQLEAAAFQQMGEELFETQSDKDKEDQAEHMTQDGESVGDTLRRSEALTRESDAARTESAKMREAGKLAEREAEAAENAEDVFRALDQGKPFRGHQHEIVSAARYAYDKGDIGQVAKHATVIERALRSSMDELRVDTRGISLEEIASTSFINNPDMTKQHQEAARMLLEAQRLNDAKADLAGAA